MDKLEINSPEPEFKPITNADFQKEYGHIPVMCKMLEHFREVFTTYTTDEKQRHIVDRTLNEVKRDLNSMTELIDRLIKENQVLSQQMQSAQSESNHLREELDAGRERNIQHPKVTCADDTAFETQFKMESLSVDQSKDRRITELEEEVAKVKRTVQQLSELVGTQKSRLVSAQQAPISPENRTNGQKPIHEPTPMDTSQFLTRQPKEIPAEDFVIIADDVELTEIGNNLILLKNILNQESGRVVGRRRQNSERLEQEYGVKIHVFDVRPEKLNIIISEGDADSRRAASNDIIEKLPVVFECPNLKIDSTALQNATFDCDVTIQRKNLNSRGVTICGRIINCRQAYKLLVPPGSRPPPPAHGLHAATRPRSGKSALRFQRRTLVDDPIHPRRRLLPKRARINDHLAPGAARDAERPEDATTSASSRWTKTPRDRRTTSASADWNSTERERPFGLLPAQLLRDSPFYDHAEQLYWFLRVFLTKQPPPPPPQQLQQQQQQQETQNPMTSSVFSEDLGGSSRPLTGSSSPRDPSHPWFSGIVSHEDPTRGGSDPQPIPPPVASPGHSSPIDPDGSDAQSRGLLPPGQQLGSGPSQSVEQQHDDERVYSQNRISNMSQSQKPATIVPQQSQPHGTLVLTLQFSPSSKVFGFIDAELRSGGVNFKVGNGIMDELKLVGV
ncbi:hypothetical protein DAPPUDRAFT_107362 [Daphnia pulex]|uniref:K Homology domain-containing protein n=1 Tax=Daphnia pulex TaxID=6669 RepID=E9GWW1_DAPPU|nr:hypothetical protein DAPPUDRAFT_107362 [Daphnia pulex]|eukprot:EFX75971.1 hypothetical protein DAPPUDRAFT_107362 [Daphnia pulex]